MKVNSRVKELFPLIAMWLGAMMLFYQPSLLAWLLAFFLAFTGVVYGLSVYQYKKANLSFARYPRKPILKKKKRTARQVLALVKRGSRFEYVS